MKLKLMKTQNRKRSNKNTKKNTIKTKVSSDYIVIDGVTYEKLSHNSVSVKLDIQQDVLKSLDALVKSGSFVSRGDAIRTILRKKIEQMGLEKIK